MLEFVAGIAFNLVYLLTKIDLRQVVGNTEALLSYDMTFARPNINPQPSSRQIFARQFQTPEFEDLQKRFIQAIEKK